MTTSFLPRCKPSRHPSKQPTTQRPYQIEIADLHGRTHKKRVLPHGPYATPQSALQGLVAKGRELQVLINKLTRKARRKTTRFSRAGQLAPRVAHAFTGQAHWVELHPKPPRFQRRK